MADDRDKLDDITNIALKAGSIICESSGETYRAEDTISIIGHSLGADTVQPYVTPTGIILYTEMQDPQKRLRTESRMLRIKKRSTNLGKITQVNSLSRAIALNHSDIDYADLEKKISRIENTPNYNTSFSLFITALSGFTFTLMFSGTVRDAIIAAGISFVMSAVFRLLTPLKLSGFISTIIGGSVVSFCAGLLSFLGLKMSFNIVNVGSLMYLMPGVALVIAIRDIIAGDYVSGTARAMEAFVVALALSVGAAAGLLIFPDALDYNTSMTMLSNPLAAFMLAAVASACFACVFQVKNKFHIFLTAIAGGISWLLYILLTTHGVGSMNACFLGSFAAGIISEIFALVFKAPSTVFFIPALISFVPGGGMYATMYNAVLGKTEAFSESLLSTLSIAGAIALAIAFATGVARIIAKLHRHPGSAQKVS